MSLTQWKWILFIVLLIAILLEVHCKKRSPRHKRGSRQMRGGRQMRGSRHRPYVSGRGMARRARVTSAPSDYDSYSAEESGLHKLRPAKGRSPRRSESTNPSDEGESYSPDESYSGEDKDDTASYSSETKESHSAKDRTSTGDEDDSPSRTDKSYPTEDESLTGDDESYSTEDESRTGDNESPTSEDESLTGDNESSTSEDETPAGDVESQSPKDKSPAGDDGSHSSVDESPAGDDGSHSPVDESPAKDDKSYSSEDESPRDSVPSSGSGGLYSERRSEDNTSRLMTSGDDDISLETELKLQKLIDEKPVRFQLTQETCDTMQPPAYDNITAVYQESVECNYTCNVRWLFHNKLIIDFSLVDKGENVMGNATSCLLKGVMAQVRDVSRPLGKFLKMIDLYIYDCQPGKQNLAIRMYQFPKQNAHMEWLPPGTLSRKRLLNIVATYIKIDHTYWTKKIWIPRRPLRRRDNTRLKVGPNFPKPDEYYE